MPRQAEEANPTDEPAELAADGDLTSLARLLYYAKREAEALGQAGAASLVDATLLFLAMSSAEGAQPRDALEARGDSVRDLPGNGPTRAHN
jgi:hypothetical protein